MPIALLLKLATRLLPLLSLADKALSLVPFNGKKTELAMALKLALLPLLAQHVPGFQPEMAGLAYDTAAELLIALFACHKLLKVLIVRLKASVQK